MSNHPGLLDHPIDRGQKDGDEALVVRRVQEWLTLHGSQTRIDGDFGPGTEAAVSDFQRKQRIPETGIVDEGTWRALTKPMRDALASVPVQPSDTSYDVVLNVARNYLAIRPIELCVENQSNCGPWVRLFMHGEEGTNQPWCAGFVSHVIVQAAHTMGKAELPIPRQVGVDFLVRDAKEQHRFLDGGSLTPYTRTERVPRGALFVTRKTPSDWTHVGIVTDVRGEAFHTIEGNTNPTSATRGQNAHNSLISGSRKPKVGTTRPRAEGEDKGDSDADSRRGLGR